MKYVYEWGKLLLLLHSGQKKAELINGSATFMK